MHKDLRQFELGQHRERSFFFCCEIISQGLQDDKVRANTYMSHLIVFHRQVESDIEGVDESRFNPNVMWINIKARAPWM